MDRIWRKVGGLSRVSAHIHIEKASGNASGDFAVVLAVPGNEGHLITRVQAAKGFVLGHRVHSVSIESDNDLSGSQAEVLQVG